ncbi:unnamed protein product [Urochloa humidicola]
MQAQEAQQVEIPQQVQVAQPVQNNAPMPPEHPVMVDLAFDLNMAPPHDMGEIDVDNAVPVVADNMEPPELDMPNIIDGTDSSGGSADDPQAPGFGDNMEVEVFIPQENGQPIQFLPDDIDINDLMNENDEVAAGEEPNVMNQNIQLGYVHVPEINFAEHFESQAATKRPSLFQGNPNLVRHWANHFTPGQHQHQVEIPVFWSDFFTAQLLNPLNFQWAKEFLSSPAVPWLDTGAGMITFSLPQACPLKSPPTCAKVTEMEHSPQDKGKVAVQEGLPLDQIAGSSSTAPDIGATSPQTPLQETIKKVYSTPGPWSRSLLEKAGKLKAAEEGNILSDEDLRRSKRKAIQNKGFRTPTCKDSTCIGCTAKPPVIPHSVVKNLGEAFCKIDAGKLTSQALNIKKQAAPPGGKKQLKKKPTKSTDDEADPRNLKKKPKKQ